MTGWFQHYIFLHNPDNYINFTERILSSSRRPPPPIFAKFFKNCLRCTQKILGGKPPKTPCAPLSSDPGSATDAATPLGRHCHSPNTLSTLSPQGCYIGPMYAPSGVCTLIQTGERGRFCENHIVEKG